jgi:hypothetical protein
MIEFGYNTNRDFIDTWLEGAKFGRSMLIDSPNARQMIKEEIAAVKKSSKERIELLESLLLDSRYFHQDKQQNRPMKSKAFLQILTHLRSRDSNVTADIFFRNDGGYWTARFLREYGGAIIEAGDGKTPQQAMENAAWMYNQVFGRKTQNKNK